MRIGRVVGTLVATRKEPELEGLKLLVVKDIDETLAELKGLVVAVDSVGAGVGEVVLYASGSSARQTEVTRERPVDHVVMAIVDQFEIGGETLYTKDSA